jgi:hypothetical protein
LISKSNNKNQVHYAVRVDDACAPIGPAPVHPYWRMLERSPDATEGLTEREERGFGVLDQRVEGSFVTFTLRGLPSRIFTIETWRNSQGACSSQVTTSIAGMHARLFNIHVVLKLFSIDHVLFTGWADNGAVIREQVHL